MTSNTILKNSNSSRLLQPPNKKSVEEHIYRTGQHAGTISWMAVKSRVVPEAEVESSGLLSSTLRGLAENLRLAAGGSVARRRAKRRCTTMSGYLLMGDVKCVYIGAASA